MAVIATDLDGTLVDHEDATHAALLALYGKIDAAPSRPRLVYNTGRSPTLYAELAGTVPLREPDVLICSVGTEVILQGGTCDAAWEKHLDDGGWDGDVAKAAVAAHCPDATLQQTSEQRRHKLSFKLHDEAQADALAAALPPWARVVFSGGEDLDVIPQRAGKGEALKFVLAELGAAPERTLVCGDSGNDKLMLGLDGVKACVVGNAMAELVAWMETERQNGRADHVFYDSGLRCSYAIAAALERFGLLL